MQCDVYNREDYGGFWRRYFADFIDVILLGIASSVVSAAPSRVAWILEILIFLSYMIGFKVRTGATPGYHLLGMKIVAINGGHVTVTQIVVRLISSIFSALAFGLGFLWIAFDANKQAWHDKIAGTYVIRSSAKPIRTVQIPQTSLIRVKLFASEVVAMSVLVVGFVTLVMRIMGVGSVAEFWQLQREITTLSTEITEKYKGRVYLYLVDAHQLNVFLINSSFNEWERDQQEIEARGVAELVRDEYPGVEEIASISICPVAEKSGFVTYREHLPGFSFSTRDLGNLGDLCVGLPPMFN